MAKELEQVRLAMNAVSEAKRDERRQRMTELYAAVVQLQATVARAQYLGDEKLPEGEKLSMHERLVRMDRWLTEHAPEYPPNDPEFIKREGKYIHDVMAYQEAMDLLSAAYEMVRDASRSPSMPAPKKEVWRQLGEAPF